MNANELRIGNYLNTPRADQSPFRIDVIEFASKNNIKVGMNVHKLPHPFNENQFIDAHPLTWELKELKPIELTEEILLNCGFVKDEFDNWENETRLGLYKPEEFDGYLSVWGESTVGECNYLHQLQNLYFALTGQELEINL